jgi:hypothetical protein
VSRFLLVGLAIVALALGGCGAGQSNDPPHQARRTMFEWDATGATNQIASYRTELKSELVHAAAEHDDVFAVALDGQPITTASINAHDFAQPPPEAEGEEVAEADDAFAEGMAHDLVASATRETVAGSGQLQGLLVAAHTPGIGEVILWSDGVVNEQGFDLSAASGAEVSAEIALWKPKLAGLRGVTVQVVGVGRGVHLVATVERAHELFSALVNGNGGHLAWTPTLAQG